MLQITCPWCGARDEPEFRYGGPGSLVRPKFEPSVTDTQWAEYLFERSNPRGTHAERWVHSFGCGLWFSITRDTVTHEIIATAPLDLNAIPSSADCVAGR